MTVVWRENLSAMDAFVGCFGIRTWIDREFQLMIGMRNAFLITCNYQLQLERKEG